jgi:hypothetical protein
MTYKRYPDTVDQANERRRRKKRERLARQKARANPKRLSSSFGAGLKRLNPAFKGATSVRVKKLKGGGVTITPVR